MAPLPLPGGLATGTLESAPKQLKGGWGGLSVLLICTIWLEKPNLFFEALLLATVAGWGMEYTL